jgi:hypothetical protein
MRRQRTMDGLINQSEQVLFGGLLVSTTGIVYRYIYTYIPVPVCPIIFIVLGGNFRVVGIDGMIIYLQYQRFKLTILPVHPQLISRVD